MQAPSREARARGTCVRMHAPRAAGGVSDKAATAAVVAESHHISEFRNVHVLKSSQIKSSHSRPLRHLRPLPSTAGRRSTFDTGRLLPNKTPRPRARIRTEVPMNRAAPDFVGRVYGLGEL